MRWPPRCSPSDPIERPVLQRDDLVDALRQYSIGAAPRRLLAAALSPGRAALLADLLGRAARCAPSTPRPTTRSASPSRSASSSTRSCRSTRRRRSPSSRRPTTPSELQPPGDEPAPRRRAATAVQRHGAGRRADPPRRPDRRAAWPPIRASPRRSGPTAARPTDLIYPPTDDLRGARAFRYDEWNYHDRRYLRSWCRVLEQRLHGDDASFIGDVRRRHAVLASRVRRQFSFVRPEGWVRVHHADDGDELDIDAVIEAVVDRRTGTVPDDNVHIRRERAARDVATAFLVDLSASTSSPVVDEEELAAVTEQEVARVPVRQLRPLRHAAATGAVAARARRRQGVGRPDVRRPRGARRPARRLRLLRRGPRPRRLPRRQGLRRPHVAVVVGRRSRP